MFEEIKAHASFNDVTGYGIHASNFFPALQALLKKGGTGSVHISLLDVVTASHTTERYPAPSILYNVWESTEYPAEFMDKIKLYDQMWVPSKWQKEHSVKQGIPEDFVKVVPEGVNPDIYKPAAEVGEPTGTFDFLLVGKWEPRKSNLEICRTFLAAFPADQYPNVRMYLSCDTMFPCDQYKSTEERLKGYGIEDPRFIIVHFEERESYIRRLQAAHVFVSCSRAEGWGLPIIESMACGIPTIVADWSGSTEYAGDALKVRVKELKKPEGIYGGWDVPGLWGEPDYDHLREVMKDAYDNYATHKKRALQTSNYIRSEFSWAKAAEKAYAILEELSGKTPVVKKVTEADIIAYARKHGYEIGELHKRRAIFTVDCHPDSPPKMDTLVESIKQIKGLDYPVLVVSHLPLPPEVVQLTDFYIYDKRDVLSPPEDMPVYWKRNEDGTTETTNSNIPCHAVAALQNVRNAIDFCMGKYEWVYHMSYDTEVDLEKWLERVHSSDKSFFVSRWENQPNTASGQLMASTPELFDKILPRIATWAEWAKVYGDDRFCGEQKAYKLIAEHIGLENVEFVDMEIGNRFNQVDYAAFPDDFQCHYVEGPFLNIVNVMGDSKREYDVSWRNPRGIGHYDLKQKCGMFSRPNTKYYLDWTVRASIDGEVKYEKRIDLNGHRVLICMGSKALGDTIAWMPYIEEFRKKQKCHVICSGWWTEIFDYPELEFVAPGTRVENLHASYEVGCFDDQLDKNVVNWRLTPLQKVASDILGLEYEPIRAKLKHERPKRGNGGEPKPYICFSEFSTMQNKYWNRQGAWQRVIDYLVGLGYECISVSSEKSMLENITSHNGQTIQQTINDISGAEFYVGLNHGPSWIAYSLGIPVIMITGVSEEWNDFPNPYRIAVDVGCKPCFNDTSVPINRSWDWCHASKDYACTREITEEMVIEMIDKLRGDLCVIKNGGEGAPITDVKRDLEEGLPLQ